MEIGGYKLESVKRFEPAMNAAFVRKGDALLVATRGKSEYTLELLDLRKFTTLARASVPDLATLRRVGDQGVLLKRKRDLEGPEEDKSKQTLEVRNLKDFGLVTSFVEEKPGHTTAHPDGTRIAVTHDFGGLNIWDARTGELLHEYASKGVGGVAYSGDGALLAAKEFAGSLRIFDANQLSAKPLRSAAAGRGEAEIAFHPRRHVLAAAGKTAIKILDADTTEVTASIKTTSKERQGAVGHMSFSPDGKLLVTSSLSHGAIGLWDVEKAAFIGHMMELNRPVSTVEFDAEGKYLLIATYKAAELYAVSAA
jgi:WD40 repeat protein